MQDQTPLWPTRSCVTATNGSEVQGMIARIIFALWILPATSLAWAHDDIHDQWYESLTVPGTTNGCCNGYDCKPTEAEIRDDQWWARDPDGKWIKVPEHAVIEDKGNPVGQPILCMTMTANEFTTGVFRRVRCFVPGALI
jgi:hypothetical protein